MNIPYTKGLFWGGREHRWEGMTNFALVFGIITTGLMLYFNIYIFNTNFVGFSFLLVAGFCHLIARISHMMEKMHMKVFRPWTKGGK